MATEKRKVNVKVYSIAKPVDANMKCPPQARLIVDTIQNNGGKMDREALLTALKRTPEQGGLKTNQTAERILGFYRPRLTAQGVLVETSEEREVEVEVPNKPAAPAAPASPAAPAAGEPAKQETSTKAPAGEGKAPKGPKAEKSAA